MVFHRSLNDSKFSQVSRTLLSILADLNNAVVWTVSTRPVISKSSRPWGPITIGIIVTFMFHSFFNSLARSNYLTLFSHPFNLTLWSAGTSKFPFLQIISFLLIIIRPSRLVKSRWSVWMSKSQRSLCVSFQDRFWYVHIAFVRIVTLQFLAQLLLLLL